MPKRVAPGAAGTAAEGRGKSSFSGRAPNSIPEEQTQAALLRRLKRQHKVELTHLLGPRVVLEPIDELGRHLGLGEDLDCYLGRHAALNPDNLRAVAASQFSAFSIRVVEGEP